MRDESDGDVKGSRVGLLSSLGGVLLKYLELTLVLHIVVLLVGIENVFVVCHLDELVCLLGHFLVYWLFIAYHVFLSYIGLIFALRTGP